MKKIKAYVINHGHMDIEWYQPLSTFGMWFRESIEMLSSITENDRDYACYVYDGAVFPVLYAIACDPNLKTVVEKLTVAGKLKLGPFYTQFDEFLTCGENIIKNCLWGDRKSRELKAASMKAGYLLDNFGHPAQLPQILNNFRIRSLFFSRGMCDIGDQVKEFVFYSPDGSAVCAQNFSYSTAFRIYDNNDPRPGFPNYLPYYRDEFLEYEYLKDISKHVDHEGIARQFIDGVKENARYYPSGIIPVFAGTDHCPPQEGLSKTLSLANAMQDEIEFVFTDAEELSDALNQATVPMAEFRGDLIGSKYDLLLFGAMTTRIYLKQKMYACERLLFDYALPLAAYTKYFALETTQNELDEATRLLMINSTHDSIHGSSVDAVHRENEFRFDRAGQNCAYSVHDSLKKLSGHMCSHDGQDEFLVFSPRDYDGYISAWLITKYHEVVITDADGIVYDHVITPQKEIIRNAMDKPYYQRPVGDSVREVVFRAKLHGGEVKKFFYRPADEEISECAIEHKHLIGNEFFTLGIDSGHLTLVDHTTKETLTDFLSFTEEAETGDVFDHSSPWIASESYCSDSFGYTDVEVLDARLFEQLSAKCTMRVPMETIGDKRSDTMTDLPILLTFRLWKGIKRLDTDITIRNYSKNHRVRAVFSLPFAFDHVKANEIFCAEDFSVQRPRMTDDWWEEPTRELPFRDWISVNNRKERCTIASKGLYVFEPLDNRRIAFTLFRSVGELMRINLKNRAGCCAAGFPVPEAQCLREMTFEFSLFSHRAEDSVLDIDRLVDCFILPPAVHAMRHPMGKKDKASSIQLFRFIDNNSFAVSVFELSYDREFYVLRFYEKNGHSAIAKIDLSHFDAVYRSDMNETVLESLTRKDGIAEIEVPAYKVITLLMK